MAPFCKGLPAQRKDGPEMGARFCQLLFECLFAQFPNFRFNLIFLVMLQNCVAFLYETRSICLKLQAQSQRLLRLTYAQSKFHSFVEVKNYPLERKIKLIVIQYQAMFYQSQVLMLLFSSCFQKWRKSYLYTNENFKLFNTFSVRLWEGHSVLTMLWKGKQPQYCDFRFCTMMNP